MKSLQAPQTSFVSSRSVISNVRRSNSLEAHKNPCLQFLHRPQPSKATGHSGSTKIFLRQFFPDTQTSKPTNPSSRTARSDPSSPFPPTNGCSSQVISDPTTHLTQQIARSWQTSGGTIHFASSYINIYKSFVKLKRPLVQILYVLQRPRVQVLPFPRTSRETSHFRLTDFDSSIQSNPPNILHPNSFVRHKRRKPQIIRVSPNISYRNSFRSDKRPLLQFIRRLHASEVPTTSRTPVS